MSSRLPALLLAALALAAGTAAVPAQAPPSARIVVVGDIHGAGSGLIEILRAAGLIDEKQRWSGGSARLVQTGDFTDRGPDVKQVIDLLMRLEGEARRAGGRVDVLFGNHEGMNVLRDLRDVSPKAYAAFADKRSEDRRRKAFETHAKIVKRAGGTIAQDAWMKARPAGFVEYVQAFGPGGEYGRWMRSRKPILQIGDAIFMHAGLNPHAASGTIDEINRAVERDVRNWDALVSTLERNELAAPSYLLQDIVDVTQVEIGRIVLAQKAGEPVAEHVTSEYVNLLKHLQGIAKWTLIDGEGPLWYRGLATEPEDKVEPALAALLTRLGAARFVTGHTPQLESGRITMRLGGRVVLIDTGMLTSYFRNGRPSALEILDGRMTAIYASGREPLGP